ncbi:MAG: hypothetical protein GY906_24850 [bacterium]|nr:hypothetical protein [bacterium]
MSKTCSKCKEEKDSKQFHPYNGRMWQGLNAWCIPCHKDYYKRQRINNKMYLLRQVGGKCELCGWKERPDVLQFDHIVPFQRKKETNSFWAGRVITNPKIWDEFHHTQVLCPNCHSIKTKDNGELVGRPQVRGM